MTEQTSPAGGDDVDPGDPSPAEEPADEDVADRVSDVEAAIDEARRRVAEAPAEVVVVNHVMGLYELAAIHLSSEHPDLRSAALAIDALACLVEGLGDRLGENAPTMRDALSNIRLAYVQIQHRSVEALSGNGETAAEREPG